MNQLVEQPPKTGLEARLDPGVGFFSESTGEKRLASSGRAIS